MELKAELYRLKEQELKENMLAIAALYRNQGSPLGGFGVPLNSNYGAGALDVSSIRSNTLGGGDQLSISREADSPDGQVNPQLLKMMYETRLQSDLQSLESAKASGEEDRVTQATEALGSTYSETQQKGIPISQEIEGAVKQALGILDGQDGGSGGGGNLDALNKGGFQADDGSSGGSGGGGGCGGGGGGGCSGGGGCVNGGGGGGGVSPKNLTEDDKQFLNQAITSESKSFGDLVGSWRQGPDGNCSTVACIKAAMDRYDNKVFDEVQRTENGYSIAMQDGYKMTMSDSELAAAKEAAKFRGPDGPGKSYATFLYGAAAKRNSLDNGMSLGQSFNDLNDGENIYSPAKLLGLYDQMVPVNAQTLDGQDSVVAGSNRHAVFVNRNADGSHTTDRWGSARPFNGTDALGNGLVNAYTFKPRNWNGSGTPQASPRSASSSSRSSSTRSGPSSARSGVRRPSATSQSRSATTRTSSKK